MLRNLQIFRYWVLSQYPSALPCPSPLPQVRKKQVRDLQRQLDALKSDLANAEESTDIQVYSLVSTTANRHPIPSPRLGRNRSEIQRQLDALKSGLINTEESTDIQVFSLALTHLPLFPPPLPNQARKKQVRDLQRQQEALK